MACGQTGWSIREGELARHDVRALLDLHVGEMRACSPDDACHVMPADDLDRPDLRFFTLRDAADVLLAIGALRAIAPDHGEIKSMRAAPTARRTGAGRALLRHLIDTARSAGMTRLSLETGNDPLFDAALALYRSEGFMECAPFAHYRPSPFTRFFTRAI